MFTKKEIVWTLIAIAIMGFILGWSEKVSYSPAVFLISAIIILTSICAKKIAAPIYSIQIEHKIWHFQHLWFSKKDKLKKPFPIGLLLPFILSFLSLGLIKLFTLLQFDYKNDYKKRVLKRRGLYRSSEINESDPAFTAAWGFWALIALAILCAILNQPQITKYAILYGIWNMIPLSNLDGSRLFFGSPVNWILLAIVHLIVLALIML